MKVYIHEFLVSSGKSHKLITKVYTTYPEAAAKWRLLGGSLMTAEVINVEGAV